MIINPIILRIINKDFGGSLVAFHPSFIFHINLGFIKLISPVKKIMPKKIQDTMFAIRGISNFNQLLHWCFIYLRNRLFVRYFVVDTSIKIYYWRTEEIGRPSDSAHLTPSSGLLRNLLYPNPLTLTILFSASLTVNLHWKLISTAFLFVPMK